jgi:hypothetical protein
MHKTIRIATGCVLLFACLVTAACHTNVVTRQTPGAGATSKPTIKAGLEFKKVAIGLPSQTLDYIGQPPNGLAGARPAEKVFFSVRDDETVTIYCRDLKTGTRTQVAQVSHMIRGSLTASSDGRYLCYCKAWETKQYIDDPAIKGPEGIAVVMRIDVATGKEEEIFDYRAPEWRRFRSDSITPFLSADGSRILALAYDYDQALLAQHLNDWVAYAADFDQRKTILIKPDIDERLKVMRQLTQDERVAPKLKALGVEPSKDGEIPAKERAAMQKLAQQASHVDAVVLSWENNQASMLPVKFAAADEGKLFFILAAGAKTLLLGAQDTKSSSLQPQQVYRCDLTSGEVSQFTLVPGPSSSIQLNAAEDALLAVYNPYDAAKREVKQETHLLSIPLAGGAPVDKLLNKDFLGYADVLTDGSSVVGQDQGDLCLYKVDVQSGQAVKLVQLLGPVDGMFLAGTGERMAYLENGLLLELAIPASPEQSKDWIGEAYFDQFKPAITKFMTDMGYTLPAAAAYRWEERDGMGAHEVAVEIRDPLKPTQPVLLRYNVAKKQMASMWFPSGCAFPIAAGMQGSKLDYYGCKDIAEKALNSAGWLPGDTRDVFQPSANPLYDSKSDSYIVTYRDGYWLGKGEGAKWVTDKEATIRVIARNGNVAEMTLAENEPVMNQPLTINYERAVFLIRNVGDMKITEKMPVKFDTDKVRLIVVPKFGQADGPAKYNLTPAYRLCYEIDAFIQPENELILTSRVDTETGDIMGQLDFQPSNIAPVKESP